MLIFVHLKSNDCHCVLYFVILSLLKAEAFFFLKKKLMLIQNGISSWVIDRQLLWIKMGPCQMFEETSSNKRTCFVHMTIR